ncbi:hypothetical protein CNY89_18535 [Amaricoccus sp. HAR-UPW-R2A-40]|nr:hypothetical protein CNY89_18535 [Amaricoccus sp. HAR-UPW-R2A-40]
MQQVVDEAQLLLDLRREVERVEVACASRLLAAAARSAAAVKSIRVIAIATICSDLLPSRQRVRDRAVWEFLPGVGRRGRWY